MNCREAENLIAAGIYGRLTPEERGEIEAHARTCWACADRLGTWAAVLDLKARPDRENVPLPDWEKSWSRIAAETVDRRPRRSVFRRPAPGWSAWARWTAAAAAVVLVFAAGYFAGRRFLIDRSGETVRAAGAGPSGVSPLAGPGVVKPAEYADSLRPLLVDFLNRGDARPPEGLVELKRRLVRDMIGQTRLLRRLAAESGDAGFGDLLSDLEFILTSMANLDPGDEESAERLARMIREGDISLRLRDLAESSTL